MWLWMTALLAVSLTPSTVEHEGVRVSVSIQSHIYTWEITNLGAPPITSFEIETHSTYDEHAPAGWAIEIDGNRFRAWATDEKEAIHRNQTKEFTVRVSSGGAVLGRIPLTVGYDDDLEPLTVDAVWGPVRKPRSMVVLVALTVAVIALVHALLLTRRSRSTHMANAAPPSALSGRIAVWQLLILLGVCLLAFRGSGATMMHFALNDGESAHLLAAPVLIGLLVLRRRQDLKQQLSRGSIWGVALVLAGLTAHAAAQWPFNFTSMSWFTIAPIMAGIILAVGGWSVLKLCGPMLLILLLAIPISPRHYAFMIIGPETLTLRAVQVTLDLLPGVFVELAGPELSYFGSQGAGHIALGEPHRGASLFLAYVSITVFITFASIRAPWQVAAMGFAAAPIALICNYSRLVMWGAVTIYGGAGPLSPYPRVIATILSLLGAWGLSVLGVLVASKIVRPRQPRLGSGNPRPIGIPE